MLHKRNKLSFYFSSFFNFLILFTKSFILFGSANINFLFNFLSSGIEEQFEAITGFLHAPASAIGYPNPSSLVGYKTTLHLLYSSANSFWDSLPNGIIFFRL